MSLPSKKPVNYLNNKDILKEIHESKNTYCYFQKQEYHRYDYIVDMPQEDLEKSLDRKSTRLNSSHIPLSRMPSSA